MLPFSLATPPAFDGPLPDAVDVVVIGGGIVGVMSAWQLARAGRRVLLCEKGRVAAEQSGRNWGWIRQQGRDLAELALMMEASRRWRDLVPALRAAVGYRQGGITYLARSAARMAAFEDWVQAARPQGVDSRLLSSREIQAMLPNAAGWIGALHTPSDGQAEPFVAVPALAHAAAADGILIREGCAVRGLDLSAGRIAGVVTEAGRVRCEQVILAGGAWSSLFLRGHGVRIPQLAVISTVAATTALPGFFPAAAADDRLAIRRRLDGGYTLAPGSFHELPMGPDAFRHLRAFLPQIRAELSATRFRIVSPRGWPDGWRTPWRWTSGDETPFERCRILDPRPNTAAVARLQGLFGAAFPAIGSPPVAGSWAGLIDVLPDSLPIVDHGPIPGLIVATGMSGHGFGIAPAIGAAVRDLALQRQARHELSPFRFGRFSDGSRPATPSAL